jgi:MscS family membrane protein
MELFDALKSSPWVTATIALFATLVTARLLVMLVAPLLRWLVTRSSWSWDDVLVKATVSPLCLLLAVQLLRFVLPLLPSLEPTVEARQLLVGLTTALTTVSVLWAGFRLVDVAVSVVITRPWAAGRPSTRSLLAISGRFAKVVIVLISAIAVLAHLGVPVASLIAGLGVGGLALALAAQKTVENLFGTLSIGVDQPFRETDFVRIGELTGSVEAIGLRSTRIRTLDRTLVTIPNGKLADLNVESYTARDRMRLACELHLEYGTTSAQLRAILEEIEQLLRAHPKIWPDEVTVRFKAFGAASLVIEVMAWFQTSQAAEFQLIRQEVLLSVMEIVERHRARFATTQKLLLAAGGASGGPAGAVLEAPAAALGSSAVVRPASPPGAGGP